MIDASILSLLGHPLGACSGDAHQIAQCQSYNFWSGIAGSFVIGSGIWAGVYHATRKHNCHVRGCWRIGRHRVQDTDYVVCRKHHPEDKPTVEHIHRKGRAG